MAGAGGRAGIADVASRCDGVLDRKEINRANGGERAVKNNGWETKEWMSQKKKGIGT
jgi:hypothetical protein